MMSTKIMHWIGLLIYLSSVVNCVLGQATTDQCRSDDNGGLQTVLLEQTLQTLQAMNERLQAMNKRLQAMNERQQAVESRLESIENQHVSNKQWLNTRLDSLEKQHVSINQWMNENDKGICCELD